jgi:DNA-binding transcriptional LysR family regulator
LDLDTIARFIAVVDNGSFAAAARSLDITPQALSTSIAKLEQELKLVLFDRERGGITQPTELATALLPHARFLAAAERRAVEEVHAVRDARSGWVRLGIGEAMAGAIAAHAITRLRHEAPDVHIVIVEGYMHALLERLDNGELDLIAGAPDSTRVRRRDLKQTFLYVARDVVVARREHPLASRRKVSLTDMQHYTWMLPYARSDGFEAMVNAYTEQDLQPPEQIVYSDTATVGLELLSSEDYLLMVTPDLIWPAPGPGSPFVVLNADEPTVERQACLMYRADHPLSAMATRLRDCILTETESYRTRTGLKKRLERPTARNRS